MEVVASLSQGRTVAAQCGLFTHKSVPVIFEPPCSLKLRRMHVEVTRLMDKIAYYSVASWSRVLDKHLRLSLHGEILSLLLNPKFHCPHYKLPPMDSILSHFNEIHTAIHCVEFVIVSFSHIFVMDSFILVLRLKFSIRFSSPA